MHLVILVFKVQILFVTGLTGWISLKAWISPVVLGGINILLLVYGITNSKRYSVFHGILS